LQTYVADFHGTTVLLFEKQSPDAETNKPVCFDCHGVHDISRPDDPKRGLEIKSNLLVRCQECHPDANLNFPDAWLSHYIPSAQRNTLVFSVDLFYKLLIPIVLGGMALLVVLDLSKTASQSLHRRTQTKVAVYPVPPRAEAKPENSPKAGEPGAVSPPVSEPADSSDSPDIEVKPELPVLPDAEPQEKEETGEITTPASDQQIDSDDTPEAGPEPGNE
jgi:hypothetical protein